MGLLLLRSSGTGRYLRHGHLEVELGSALVCSRLLVNSCELKSIGGRRLESRMMKGQCLAAKPHREVLYRTCSCMRGADHSVDRQPTIFGLGREHTVGLSLGSSLHVGANQLNTMSMIESKWTNAFWQAGSRFPSLDERLFLSASPNNAM